MSNWQHAQELFAQHFEGFQERAEQTGLALSIEKTLATNGRELAEAGCGTGKSFGALVPAIDWALANDETVVIATATKALQTQYAAKDLPTLAAIYEADERPFRWAVIKGRGSYLCAQKVDEADPSEVSGLEQLREELESDEGHTGDLDDVQTVLDLRQRNLLTTSSEECPGRDDCPFGQVCFAERAKAKARESQVVITNHSYLVVDAQVRERVGENSLLPEFGGVVVDEGHELVDYATNGLGKEFTQRNLDVYAQDVAKFLEDLNNATARQFFANTRALFEDALPGALRKERTLRLTPKWIDALSDHLAELVQLIRELDLEVSATKIYGDDKKSQLKKRLRKRAENLMSAINSVLTADADELVRWVEKDTFKGQDNYKIKYAPLHVGPFLQRLVWTAPPKFSQEGVMISPEKPRAVVVMSATLSSGGSFRFIAKELGLDEGTYEGFDAGSPFDFEKQAALYIPKARTDSNPKGFADPSKDKDLWRQQARAVTKQLVIASGGRALLLYTSRSAMEEAIGDLREDFEDEGFQVLAQGQEGWTNRQLADEFRRDETSVLFALKSFMTGADFQGRTCQLVIIDKVPFAVPTDVIIKARDEAADRAVAEKYGKSLNDAKWHPEGSFYGRAIPAASMTLAQGTGRGVRTVNDHALLAILDPRLLTKGYGKQIIKTLPPARRVNDLPSAKEYLSSLN